MDSEGRDPRSDQALVDAAGRGDAAAFEALYYRYRDWVVRLAYRFAGNDADALDVLQECFVYVVKKLPSLRLSASMTTFLYPAIKHLSLNARRRTARHVSDEDTLAAAAAPEGAGAAPGDLEAVVAGLPEAQREVVVMRFVDDMALEEIAQALEIPVGTVKSRLHNALAALREDPRTREYFLE